MEERMSHWLLGSPERQTPVARSVTPAIERAAARNAEAPSQPGSKRRRITTEEGDDGVSAKGVGNDSTKSLSGGVAAKPDTGMRIPRKRLGRVLRSSAPKVDLAKGPPLLGLEGATVVLREPLRFAWEARKRSDIVLEDLSAVENPRPDVQRALKVIPECDGDTTAQNRRWLGHKAFVVPAGLPCDVSFIHSLDELIYLDTAAWLLSGEERESSDYSSPLLQIEGFCEYPFAYHTDSSLVKRWKAGNRARPVLRITLGERDWEIVRRVSEDPSVFFPEPTLHPCLTCDDFAIAPRFMEDYDASAGFVVPLPWVVRFFAGAVSASPSDVVKQRYDHYVAMEWAYLVGEAYAHELYRHRRAWVMPTATIEGLTSQWERFEELPSTRVAECRVLDFREVRGFMVSALEMRGGATLTSDYCTGWKTERLFFDPVAWAVCVRDQRSHRASNFRWASAGKSGSGAPAQNAPVVAPMRGGAAYAMLSPSELARLPLVGQVLEVSFDSEQSVGDVIMMLASTLRATQVHLRTESENRKMLEEEERTWRREAVESRSESDRLRQALTVAKNPYESAEKTLRSQYREFAGYVHENERLKAEVGQLRRRLAESSQPGSTIGTRVPSLSLPFPKRRGPAPAQDNAAPVVVDSSPEKPAKLAVPSRGLRPISPRLLLSVPAPTPSLRRYALPVVLATPPMTRASLQRMVDELPDSPLSDG